MSLSLEEFGVAYGGEPFCNITARLDIVTETFGYAYGGEPMVASLSASGGGPGGSAQLVYILNF